MKILLKSLLCVVLTTSFSLGASAQDMAKLIGKWVISSVSYEMPEGPGDEITEKTKEKFAELNTKESKENALQMMQTYQYALEFKAGGQVVESYFNPMFGSTTTVNLQIVMPAGSGTTLTPNSMLCPAPPAWIGQDEKGNLMLYITNRFNEGVVTALTYVRKK